VRRELPRVDHQAEFRIALAEAHNLDRGEVTALLHAHRDARAVTLSDVTAGLRGAIAKGVRTQYLLELEREASLQAADLEWLDHLILRLESEEFPWGAHEPSQRYLEQRKAARL
jgi:hypothetical protein